jgi:hypothetical protein
MLNAANIEATQIQMDHCTMPFPYRIRIDFKIADGEIKNLTGKMRLPAQELLKPVIRSHQTLL